MSTFDTHSYDDEFEVYGAVSSEEAPADEYAWDAFAPAQAPEAPRHVRRGLEDVIGDLVEIIETAKQMPLSNSALISRDEVLELLREAMDLVPDEIRQARHVLSSADVILERAEVEANQLLDEVRARAASMVEKAEVVRLARQRAEQIVLEAKAQARQRIIEADEYIDGKLGGFEVVLGRLAKSTASAREAMNSRTMPAGLLTPATEAPATTFFDQERE
ncbi:MAG: hypothetical protein KGR42_02270 [Acidobacteria bacterium]|nr:hypothetical protein [Acidobacteriota bacterium]